MERKKEKEDATVQCSQVWPGSVVWVVGGFLIDRSRDLTRA